MTFKISGWVPYWQYAAALLTIEKNKDIFGDILLFDWECHADSTVKTNWYDPVPVAKLKTMGLPYWATFTSAMTGLQAADLFDNTAKSQVLVNNMIAIAKNIGAAGLDLDFESINFKHSGDSKTRLKANYPKFIALLKKSAGTLKISATIPARVSDTDPDWAVYDFAAIGKVSDLVRIMSYDYHTGGDTVGPVSPLPWYNKVQTYAKSRIPAAKLQMGIPAYGYNWPSGNTVNAREADALAKSHGTTVSYNKTYAEGTFSYSGNTVWVATSDGMATRAKSSKDAGVNGAAIWSIGDEKPDAWVAIRKAIVVPAPIPKPVPPKPVVKPKVSVKAVQPGKKNSQVSVVQKALKQAGFTNASPTGVFDFVTKTAYAKFQKTLGYSGADADGAPGIASLTKLGNKYGFTVTA